MPPTPLPASEVRVRSSLTLLADAFELTTPDQAMFRQASPTQTITIALGFETETGETVYATELKDAVIDESQLDLAPRTARVILRGRDATAALLDRTVQILYQRTPVDPTLASLTPITPVTTKQGRFKASDIIKDLLAGTGLDLVVQVRDYELREDFSAHGRIRDVIGQLVEPWNLTTPFKVDMTLEGKTLWLRHRDPTLTPATDYTYDVKDARLGRVSIRRRVAERFGHVRLEGLRTQTAITPTTGTDGSELTGGNLWLVGLTIDTRSVEDSYKGKELVSRIETVTTTLYPDQTVRKIVKTTYGGTQLRLVSRETTENEYETSLYEEGRLVNQPACKRTTVTVEQPKKVSGITAIRTTKLEEKVNHYDAMRYLTGATTVVSELNTKTNQLERTAMVVEKLVPTQPLIYQGETSRYRFSKKTGDWELVTRSIQDNPGRPPGGPGRRQPSRSAGTEASSGLGTQFEPIVEEATISTAPDATEVHYSNPHLTREDLQFILGQLQAASGLWEWEIQLVGASMPWLRRGMHVKLTGIKDADDQPIDLPAALIVDLSLEHREGDTPQAIGNVTLLCWTPAS